MSRILSALIVLGVVWWSVKGITDEDFDKVGVQCQKQLNATNDDLKAVMNLTTPMTQKQGCLVGCMLKKLNIMDSKNNVNLTILVTLFEDDSIEEELNLSEIEQGLKNCLKKNAPSNDECVVAKNYIDCLDDLISSSEST